MSNKPKNLELLAQNGQHIFDVTFLDKPSGDPIQPTRLSGAEQFDPLTDDPLDFVTPEIKIWDEDTEGFIAPPGAYNAPTIDLLAYGGSTGRFLPTVTGQNSRKSSDLVNQRWAIFYTTEINGNTFTTYEFFTILDDGDAAFGGVESAYADLAVVQKRAGVTAADLGLDGTDYNDLLLGLNRRASDTIDWITSRDFRLHDSDTIKLDGSDLNELMLPGYPVIRITSIKEDGRLLAASDYRIKANNGPRPDTNSGILERKPPNVWREAWERYEVIYTWGYEDPPAAVREAAEELVILVLQQAKNGIEGAGLTSLSMDGYAATFDKETLRGMLSDAQVAKLAPFQRFLAV